MGVYGFAVNKSVPWRGGAQDFATVYHYDLGVDSGETTVALAMSDLLVSAERNVHSADVTFKNVRVWGPTESRNPNQSEMLSIKDYGTTGLVAADGNWYRELAFLVVWPLGRYGSRNRPQFMRKWLRPMANLGVTPTAAINGGSKMTSNPASINSYINAVQTLAGGSVSHPICTDRGFQRVSAGALYPWLEHRQLGDEWRQ